MDKLIPAKPTEKELEEGSKERAQFRNQVVANKSYIDSAKGPLEQLKVSSSNVEKIINGELDWLQKNIDILKQQIITRRTAYNEKIELAVKTIGEQSIQNITKVDPAKQQGIINSFPFPEYKQKLSEATTSINQKEQQKKKEEDEKKMNRTTSDVVLEGIQTAAIYAFIAFFIILSLRAAGFNANYTLWRPLSFRILNFIYTFLFGFIWVPYYLVWEIRARIDYYLGTSEEKAVKAPIWYSLFPINPFTPKQPIINPDTGEKIQPPEEFDLGRLLFGYPDTDVVKHWIQCKCEEWTQQQECSLKSSILSELKA